MDISAVYKSSSSSSSYWKLPRMYTETMWFMLDLLPLQTRHKVEQVKTNFSAAKKKKITHCMKPQKDWKITSWLGRGNIWNGSCSGVKPTICKIICQLAELEQAWRENTRNDPVHCEFFPSEKRAKTLLKMPTGKTDAKIQFLVEANCRPGVLIVGNDTQMARLAETSQGGTSLLSKQHPQRQCSL